MMTPQILVVDDTAAFREPVALYLRRSGYTVIEAPNGVKALTILQCTRIDLVVLDLRMPVMDGLAMLARMRADRSLSQTPVIALTGAADKQFVVQAVKLGIRDYILKSSLSLKELLARISARLQSTPATLAAMPPPTKPERSRADAGTTGATIPNHAAGTAPGRLQSAMTKDQVETAIKNCEQVRALSPAVTGVMKLTARASCSVEDVAKALKQDQGLALKVLKLSNSVVYCRSTPVSSIDMAVSRIGMAQIRQMVMTISVIEQFSGQGVSKHLNPMHFWEHSLCCGLIAAELSRRLKCTDVEVDAAFTMSLLHDTGRMVLAEQIADTYAAVLDAAASHALPLEQVESQMLGVNHAELMELILSRWQFGQHLSKPIARHHLPTSRLCTRGAQHARETAILALSDRLAHAALVGSSGNDTIYPTQDLVAYLGLDGGGIEEVLATASDQTGDLKYTLLSRTDAQPWPSLVESLKQQWSSSQRVLFASTQPAGDPYGMVLARLTDDCHEQDKPNVAVLHVAGIKDATAAVGHLHEAETKADVGHELPVVVIGPSKMAPLDGIASPTRHVEYLTSPAPVRQVIETVVRSIPGSHAVAA